MLNERRTTNILLLIMVIPLIFFLLKTLSFIFIPLVASMFIALLFLPLMRWMSKRKVPVWLSVTTIVLIISGFVKLIGELLQFSSRELLSADSAFYEKATNQLAELTTSLEQALGIEFLKGENLISSIVNRETMGKSLVPTLDFVSDTVSGVLMMVFFAVLLLAGSVDFHKMLRSTIVKQQFDSVKTWMRIEKDLLKFLKVKFFISLGTGIATGLVCWLFGVSFPVFWGFFGFIINFVQFIGSIVTVVMVSLFAFVELEQTSLLLFFTLTATGVQVVFGGVLEPVFMGKSFSINTITVLLMLMLWGYIWSIPGLIMAIPITVFFKIVMEKFPSTRIMAGFMSSGIKAGGRAKKTG